MANDWLKVDLDLHEKPEVIHMAALLNLDVLDVVGRLIRVWAWFDKNTENGHANHVTYVTLDLYTRRNGFAEAMALAGWLEQNGTVLSLPNFGRNNGESAKKRALAAERKRKERHNLVTDKSQKSVTREEKRREYKKSSKSLVRGEAGMGGDQDQEPFVINHNGAKDKSIGGILSRAFAEELALKSKAT